MEPSSVAWKLTGSGQSQKPNFNIGEINLGELKEGYALVQTLYVSWEGNMSHAVDAQPIDICRARKEDVIIIGNSALVRVEETNQCDELQQGDVCIVYGAHQVDNMGHMVTALGYDGKGSRGFLTQRNIVPQRNLVKLPSNIHADSYPYWASFGVKYATAWSTFHLALRVYRTQVPEEMRPVLNVWGWGGGTSLGALHLAKLLGHKATMIVGSVEKKHEAEMHGIETVDRSAFSNLDYQAFVDRTIPIKDYMKAESAFMRAVKRRTNREGVDIFLDFIGQPTSNATGRALGRYGVMATSGWKRGVNVNINRARSCIGRQLYVHSHYCSRAEMQESIEFAHNNNWLPRTYEKFPFEKVLELHSKFTTGEIKSYFPIVSME